MALDDLILSVDVLRPVFRVRAILHVIGALSGLVLAVSGQSSWLVPAAGITIAVIAAAQIRTCPIPSAWVADMLYAVLIAYGTGSPVAPAMVVGWSAVMGIVDTDERRLYPVGVGLAGLAVAAALDPAGFDVTVPSAMVHPIALGAVAVFFEVMFRIVGRLLRGNAKELRAFFDRVPVALTRTSADGRLLEFNRATSEMFRNPVVGEPAAERYADPERRRRFFEQLTRDGSVRGFEALMITGPGKTIEALISANAVTDDGGRLRFIESGIFDFTSLRHLERERERLAMLIDATSDLVALGGWDGSIRYANPAARSWMRRYVSDDEYVDLRQPIRRSDEKMLVEVLRAEGSWAGMLTIRGREGDRTISVLAQVLDIAGAPTIALISRDVTHEIDTERQLKQLIRAKDELVASISHEIRTPLSVVMGLAAEVRDNYVDFDSETHKEFAAMIADQGQEMTNIVEDLLVAARADTGSIVLVPGTVDLRQEAAATLRALPNAKKAGRVENHAADECWGDASRIRQILRNLIINAQRYGGKKVVITTRKEGDTIVLDVIDDGSGVPSPETATIFEPFGRAHTAGTQPGSIGLGLSVSRDLARRMSGDLTYVRREETTVFRLTLPAGPPARDEHAEVDAQDRVE